MDLPSHKTSELRRALGEAMADGLPMDANQTPIYSRQFASIRGLERRIPVRFRFVSIRGSVFLTQEGETPQRLASGPNIPTFRFDVRNISQLKRKER